MIAENGIVEGDELRKFGQIFLNNGRVVFQEKVGQVLGYEGGKACVGQSCKIATNESNS